MIDGEASRLFAPSRVTEFRHKERTDVNDYWTEDRLIEAAQQQIERHEQLCATYPRMDRGDAPFTALARAYLEARAVLVLRNEALKLYEARA